MRHLPLILVLGLIACGPGEPTPPTAGGGGGIYAVNYPLQYFAERIAGEHLEIGFLAPPDVDPAFWSPEDDDIAALQDADLILLNGASYAKWLDVVTLPADRMVVTSAAFADSLLELPITVTHSHGETGSHAHTGTDFNTWLDPSLARKQAAAVLAALTAHAPEHAMDFERNAAALDADLAGLDTALRELSVGAGEIPLLASHPVYGYLAERYGWNLRAHLWEPDVMPSEKEWEDFEYTLGIHAAKWMLYEDTPAPEIAARLKDDFGVEVVVLRPCGNRPPRGDYLTEMHVGIQRLRAVFAP